MPFSQFSLHPALLRGIKDLGFTRPTPIQTEAIPAALTGRDLLATAATGSGKTAAFLLPILHRLMDQPRGTTRVLVLTPTRELAAQIVEDLDALAVHTPIGAAAVFGGVGMGPQEHAFRRGVDVIVATPGRLLDHFKTPYGKLSGLQVLVLDEADRMLDMGFLPDIRRVLRHVPVKRQTLFFSATMPTAIAALAREMCHDPVLINQARSTGPAVGITQALYPVAHHLKPQLLLHLLTNGDVRDALVFTRTKHRADRIARFLAQHNVKVERIHGNRSQAQRTEALGGFKSGKYRVLVATDIAARGIDVTALGHVINVDVPAAPEDYVHRVGRTARAEATGAAFTLVSPDEEDALRGIERAIDRRLPRVTIPDFDYTQKKPVELELPRPQGRGHQRHDPGGRRHNQAAPAADGRRPAGARDGRPRQAGSRPPAGGRREGGPGRPKFGRGRG